MKAAAVFIISLLGFGIIAIGSYIMLDNHFEWSSPAGNVLAEAFMPIPEPVVEPEPEPEPEEFEPEPEELELDEPEELELEEPEEPEEYIPNIVTLTLSAAGDATLGGDRRWAGYGAFMREFANSGNDHSHFLRNVAHIFYESCVTVLNLEGTLTYATSHMDKQFVFRGPPHFARILSSSHVDIVSLANNHTIDFHQRGYDDTRAALTYEDIIYFGNETNTIMEVNGIKVGFFGFRIWNDSADNRRLVRNAIADLENRGAQLIIAFHRWGVEGSTRPEPYQINMGRYSIRNGAHLVLGSHPHVVQGIEEYMGRFIVYSLADFCFGGNANPRDQDAFIFQQTFSFYNGELLPYNEKYIIPVFMSSVRYRNDFQPTPAEGDDAERILGRIERYSEWLR